MPEERSSKHLLFNRILNQGQILLS